MFLPLISFGPTEITVVIVVVLLLFGASAIPKLARSLGRAQGEFQKARKDFKQEMKQGEADQAEEERIRRSARDLGIDDAEMSLDEVKKAIAEKVS